MKYVNADKDKRVEVLETLQNIIKLRS